MPKFISLLLACWLATAGVARTQTLDKEMSALAGSLSKELVVQGSKNIAALDFTDLQGQSTELGRFLSEQLAVEMVLAKGVSVLDRANFKSILAEHNLTVEGLVKPANAKKLGEFAGVDTILTGTVTSLDAGFVLTVKAISTESSKIVAAGKITFQKTSDLQGIGNRGLPSSAPGSTPSGGAAGYQDATVIATKDIGSLRVVLKSVLPMNVKDRYGLSVNAIRCSFEFTNRETQRPLLVAMNAESQNRDSPTDALRSSVVDDRGGVWSLSSPALGGLGFVRAGVHGQNGQETYSASDIVRLLQLRDELGRDFDDPSDGKSVTYFDLGYKPAGSTPAPPRNEFSAFKGNSFISGSISTIDPGRSINVRMDFESTSKRTSTPKVIKINSEIVVGLMTSDTKRSYSLQNLTFDRVSLPAGGGR